MVRTSEVDPVHENHVRRTADLVRLQKLCDHLHRFRLHELVHFRSCLFRLLVLERSRTPSNTVPIVSSNFLRICNLILLRTYISQWPCKIKE